MHRFCLSSACFFMLLGFQLTSALPLQSAALTNEDMDVIKLLIQRLEESIPVQAQDQKLSPEDTQVQNMDESIDSEDGNSPQHQANSKPEAGRDSLSAVDLRTVKHDSSSKRYSACFGNRLDRIGSMSTLGCNKVGRQNPKKI